MLAALRAQEDAIALLEGTISGLRSALTPLKHEMMCADQACRIVAEHRGQLLIEIKETIKERDRAYADYAALRSKATRLRAAVEFYADPATYMAIAFLPDPPCGDFVEDFDDPDDPDLPGVRPGKLARATLAATEDP
jgi:hypothetical protein